MTRIIDGQLGSTKGPSSMDILGRLFTGRNLGSFGGTADGTVKPAGAAAKAPTGTGQPISILQFRGKGDDPHVLTLSVGAIPVGNLAAGTGPLTGILTYGSGNGQQQRVEFDVGSFQNANNNINIGGVSGGALISFPCTHCEFSCRNDANLIPPVGATRLGFSLQPATVTASLGIGTKVSNARATRTLWLVNDPGGAGVADGATVTSTIPPYAKSFVILRSPNKILTVNVLSNTATFDGPVTLPAATFSPEVTLSPWADTISITNSSGDGTAIKVMAILFNLGL